MSGPLDRLIDAAVKCVKCGTRGVGNCSCYVRCACGWFVERGARCRNPKCRMPSSRGPRTRGINGKKVRRG